LQDDFIYELHYREKKSQQYVMLNAEMGYTLGFQILDICSLEPVARNSVEWHCLKFVLSQIFLHFGQFYFYSRQACYKRLANWTDILTLNRFTRNAKHGFNSWKWSNLAWNFSNSLFSILWSAIASSRKTSVLILTLGK